MQRSGGYYTNSTEKKDNGIPRSHIANMKYLLKFFDFVKELLLQISGVSQQINLVMLISIWFVKKKKKKIGILSFLNTTTKSNLHKIRHFRVFQFVKDRTKLLEIMFCLMILTNTLATQRRNTSFSLQLLRCSSTVEKNPEHIIFPVDSFRFLMQIQ